MIEAPDVPRIPAPKEVTRDIHPADFRTTASTVLTDTARSTGHESALSLERNHSDVCLTGVDVLSVVRKVDVLNAAVAFVMRTGARRACQRLSRVGGVSGGTVI